MRTRNQMLRLLSVGVMVALTGCYQSVVIETPIETPAAAVGSDVTVRGEVLNIDADPMAYDGDAIISVRDKEDRTIEILIAARMNLCLAKDLNLFGDLDEGDYIEVRGELVGDGEIRPCESESHYLRQVEASN
ncbi:MAG: hypothetical protein R3284_11445 [Rubricoccaceae bacterium]|nr:hypothetical protein [Rubricoccaceae bacterium]